MERDYILSIFQDTIKKYYRSYLRDHNADDDYVCFMTAACYGICPFVSNLIQDETLPLDSLFDFVAKVLDGDLNAEI